MEIGSIELSPNKLKSTSVVYLVVSAAQNGQFDRFFEVLRGIGDLLPGLSSFVINHFCYQTSESLLSLCLARYYNILIGKRVNVTIWQGKCCKRVARRSRLM